MNKIVYTLALCFSLAGGAHAASSEKAAFTHIDGSYKVHSIEKLAGFTVVKFEKYPTSKEDKVVVLEVNQLNAQLLHQGDVIEISAEVFERDKESLEAEEVLLHLVRGKGKMRVWLPSRKGKSVHFEGASYLKMHSSDNDYLVL